MTEEKNRALTLSRLLKKCGTGLQPVPTVGRPSVAAVECRLTLDPRPSDQGVGRYAEFLRGLLTVTALPDGPG